MEYCFFSPILEEWMEYRLTQQEVRDLVVSRQRTDFTLIATLVWTEDNQTRKLDFCFEWWPALGCYRAIPIVEKDGELRYARIDASSELQLKLKEILKTNFGVEHVFFDLEAAQKDALAKALGITIL